MRLDAVTILSATLAAASIACADTKRDAPGSDTLSTLPPSQASAPVPTARGPIRVTGARLIVDSTATAPTIQETGGEYHILLPLAMARVLHDSLPGFSPLPRSAFDSSVIRWVDSKQPEASPLSVVIGDFDGDSRPDIAMMGTSLDSVAQIILLARPAEPGNTQLFFLDPRRLDMPQYPKWMYLAPLAPSRLPNGFELRTAGLRSIVFDKAEVIFYLDRGALRKAYTGED